MLFVKGRRKGSSNVDIILGGGYLMMMLDYKVGKGTWEKVWEKVIKYCVNARYVLFL